MHQNNRAGIIKPHKTTANAQILCEKFKLENYGEGERFHYINGDYSWGSSDVLGFLYTIHHPLSREKDYM